MKTEYYISQTEKLQKKLNKYLKKLEKSLNDKYGESKTNRIINGAKDHYPEIIPKIPFFDTPMYDSLLLLNSRMMALKKGMKEEGVGVEEFVGVQIETLRNQTAKIPGFVKNLMGGLYLSRLVRPMLKRVGRSATANDWPTQVIDGEKQDGYKMKIVTTNCQMLNFMCSVGEGDIQPYCTFADFTTAETLGLGLEQISSIDSGTCVYCFYKKGKVLWPEAVLKAMDKTF